MSPSFQTTAGLRAGAVAGRGGVPAHGVNPDEWVGILLDLREDFVFDDVIAGIHGEAADRAARDRLRQRRQ
ncbi:hypothetical protein [Anaerobaca lacustris]|uniref:Uncharacterized protein n=1 Tax=Anaerobaca lacustris TaxID=3044600 RepID=A0AAW6U6Z6_9BACT|nr:hypothetical protein [Sedimentisphaerales bacterium M17dextr]